MSKYFEKVSKIKYEGPKSNNPYAFKFYNPEEVIDGKTMEEHLRFSIAYWHTFTADGTDQFGKATMQRPWNHLTDPMDIAKARVEAAFEFFDKINAPFFCFHDRDIAPEGDTLRETNKNLDIIVAMIKDYLKTSKTKVLWGTANLFSNPRFVHGASTSCNADVFAYSAAQVKKALEITKELGGQNYVFWGGREGYETLLNTDMELELDNFARFLHMAVDYAKEIGFEGQFLIEPKPKEPTKHQYDFDVANVLAFLRKYDLDKYLKVNIEANHATLAAHDFQHELRYARINGVLGSIDANTGDMLLGWDTDQFPTDIRMTTLAMYEVIKMGGFDKGGLNFDAKVRRASFEPEDLFLGHIAGMDAFAKGFKVAYKLVKDAEFDKFIEERYASYKDGIGADIVSGKADFKSLEKYALEHSEIVTNQVDKKCLNQYSIQYLFTE
nr:putative gene product has significant similarity to xylose isomerases from other clostridia [Thermoanaerobacterium thermosaccharolyticum DSM 571]